MRLALIVIVAALSLGVSQAVAGGGSSTATAPIERGNEFCGLPTSEPQMGTITFTLSGSTMTTDFAVKNAAPNTTYQATLWVTFGGPFLCTQISKLGKITTNSKGSAHAQFVTKLSSYGSGDCFFGSIAANGVYNDSTFVCL